MFVLFKTEVGSVIIDTTKVLYAKTVEHGGNSLIQIVLKESVLTL